jgi:hypothetical protein
MHDNREFTRDRNARFFRTDAPGELYAHARNSDHFFEILKCESATDPQTFDGD